MTTKIATTPNNTMMMPVAVLGSPPSTVSCRNFTGGLTSGFDEIESARGHGVAPEEKTGQIFADFLQEPERNFQRQENEHAEDIEEIMDRGRRVCTAELVAFSNSLASPRSRPSIGRQRLAGRSSLRPGRPVWATRARPSSTKPRFSRATPACPWHGSAACWRSLPLPFW